VAAASSAPVKRLPLGVLIAMIELFDTNIPSENSEYLALRDKPIYKHVKENLLIMWNKYKKFADPDFPVTFSQHLDERFWEIYLCSQLIDAGLEVIPKSSAEGPDIHLIVNNQNIWIEATAPSEGINNDRVPMLEEKREGAIFPEEKILLRFTNSLNSKKKIFEKYITNGLITSNDALIIAINGKGIKVMVFDGSLPTIIKAVYPIGDYQVKFDRESLQVVDAGYKKRDYIEKKSGSKVLTNYFLDTSNEIITGLIYSAAAYWDYPEHPGSEILYIHNSEAKIKMQISWLNIGIDCHLEEGKLMFT
jgi:hypothetical protein